MWTTHQANSEISRVARPNAGPALFGAGLILMIAESSSLLLTFYGATYTQIAAFGFWPAIGMATVRTAQLAAFGDAAFSAFLYKILILFVAFAIALVGLVIVQFKFRHATSGLVFVSPKGGQS